MEEKFKVLVENTTPSSLQRLREIYPGNEGRGFLHEVPRFYLDASLDSVRPVTGEIECVIKRFGGLESNVSKDVARLWAKVNGCRYAFPWERDAFFATHSKVPNHQDRIVDLGSILYLSSSSPFESHVCVRELAARPGARVLTNATAEMLAGMYCFLFVRPNN